MSQIEKKEYLNKNAPYNNFYEHSHKFILDGFFGKKNKTVEEKVRCFLISKNIF